MIPLSEPAATIRNLVIREARSTLRDLSPGATYQLQLYTVFENKESQAFISTNFTTVPNTPGRAIIWFRNETTLLVLWQPPYPAGTYSQYKVKPSSILQGTNEPILYFPQVSIDPEDALRPHQFVSKDGEPPGPAQAAFNGLVPGRAYNISVETVGGPGSSR